VIRPGAFNGVVAYKGTYGWADMTDVKTYARSLDTLGFFAREANDLALIRAAYGHAPADPPARGVAPRIGLVRTPWWDEADPYNRKNLEEAARVLRAAGAKVREWVAPDSWTGLVPAQNRIMTKEATQSYAPERERFSHLFSPTMKQVMVDGDAVNARQYADAKKRKRAAVAQLADAWSKFDLLLTPAAKGEAPAGLGNTGDPLFNCIALPFNTGPFGLPLSVQLVGRHGGDDQLIAWARWVEGRLA
jgi:Asp-tRNA(Asn)/Glu-tRNA(Gln) amidotransferase A subunit family amidase